jgi:hypothetical protein
MIDEFDMEVGCGKCEGKLIIQKKLIPTCVGNTNVDGTLSKPDTTALL